MIVTTVGGGTGTFPVVTALRKLNIQVKTVVAVSDSGGSTGRIRDEFGFQPVGDLRQSLAALAGEQEQSWIQKILLYRFAKGDGLKGHNLGNLILTALQDMTGSTAEALRIAGRVFRLSGEVIPVTDTTVDLEITYTDGSKIVGEHTLDEDEAEPRAIDHVRLIPECTLSHDAQRAIAESDYIIIGPGDYYASIMATMVTPGFAEACRESKAKVIYMLNLMTRFTQTHGFSASHHVEGIEKQLGKPLDHILINNETLPDALVVRYAESREFPVIDDMAADPRVIRAPLTSDIVLEKNSTDTAYRSLLRHDAGKVAEALKSVLK